jgi:hypothetical protein
MGLVVIQRWSLKMAPLAWLTKTIAELETLPNS